ncbi:MAG: CBS domain-containing protein [Actinomycetota bacterium]
MPNIREVMTTHPTTFPASATVVEAAQAMKREEIGDVIVMDQADQICGVVTDRDIVVRTIAEDRDPTSTKLGEICSRDLTTLSPNDEVGDAVKLMKKNAVRRVPIVENGRPVGIVSLGDLAVTHDPNSGLAEISAAPSNN